MKNRLILISFLCAGAACLGDPPKPFTIDFDTLTPAPSLEVYQNNQKTLTITLQNNTATILTNSYFPVFYYRGGTNIINVACSWTATNCVMQVNLTPTNLATTGDYTYACGVSNSVGVTVAQAGKFKITADPNR